MGLVHNHKDGTPELLRSVHHGVHELRDEGDALGLAEIIQVHDQTIAGTEDLEGDGRGVLWLALPVATPDGRELEPEALAERAELPLRVEDDVLDQPVRDTSRDSLLALYSCNPGFREAES